MKPWKRIEPTKVTKVGFRTVVTKTFTLNNGQTFTFDTYDVEGREYVVIIALTKDNKVIVARQFRPGPEAIMDELPGGYIDTTDKDPIEAAMRELREETGYQASRERVSFLGRAPIDPYDNAHVLFYLAHDCTPVDGGQQLEDTEEAEVVLIDVPQLLQNARTGRMTTPQGVLMAYDTLQALVA
jgi:ADP-ribose pyrophosphatase